MGLIAIVRAFTHRVTNSEVIVDPGGGANVTAGHFSDPGDDSSPLPGDRVAVVPNQQTGGGSAVGYIDPAAVRKSGPGEKRIYARDASTGALIVELWLQSDGAAVLQNANGGVALAADGSVNINGVVIDAAGGITAPGSLVLNGKELDGHVHPAGTPPGNTGPNS